MRRTKTVFDRIAQQNRLLWCFLQDGTARRNKVRIFRVLFDHCAPFARTEYSA